MRYEIGKWLKERESDFKPVNENQEGPLSRVQAIQSFFSRLDFVIKLTLSKDRFFQWQPILERALNSDLKYYLKYVWAIKRYFTSHLF